MAAQAVADLEIPVAGQARAGVAAQAQGIRRMLAARAGAEGAGRHRLRFHRAGVELVAACLGVFP